MRLLFINRFFHPDQSATAQMLTDLAEGLAVSGTAVTVLTGRLGYLGGETAVPSEEQYKGVTVRRVWSTRFGRQSALGRLFDYLSFYLSSVWAASRPMPMHRRSCRASRLPPGPAIFRFI